MKKISPLTLAACLCLGTGASGIAQTTNNSILYTPNVNLDTGTQNSFVGTVGGIFLTTYSFYPQVNYLGYYDQGGDGLANSHVVSLWDNSTQTIIAQVTVPAGTAAPLIDGYRWVPLASTVQLNYGSYYVIGAQVDGVDTWGDFISNPSPDDGDSGQIDWSSQYVQLGSGWEFSRAGRYDSAGNYPAEPPNQSGSDAIYPVANLGFNLDVPEPATFGILGLGIGAIAFMRRVKR
ncbi:MAG TPA: PEP-CTERM sorting domain-containing protein [Verrucomicrobiae bacterium]|jgi:hypothetical protein|nr:PEP-CTERM sorting domain-containing protein [Verrucomicrobiae bacterium]